MDFTAFYCHNTLLDHLVNTLKLFVMPPCTAIGCYACLQVA